ncbi:hypothetical protein [Methylocaldum sp. GT1BB]|uniref:hypothetical protein n=1 Tax=Methylocaldum sp. GT1BB TaxID=3438963 RepID=UPI003DA11D80
MMSAKDVRASKKFDVMRLVLSVIFLASIPQAIKICAASGQGGVESLPGWTAAEDAELDELRAGFVLDNGMVVDLSLATSVFVNGQEQFSDRFALADDFSIDQLRGVTVNNGPNNFAMSDAGTNNMAVIQNTMDNQIITMMRSIDLTISNLKGMDFNGFGPYGGGFAP